VEPEDSVPCSQEPNAGSKEPIKSKPYVMPCNMVVLFMVRNCCPPAKFSVCLSTTAYSIYSQLPSTSVCCLNLISCEKMEVAYPDGISVASYLGLDGEVYEK